MFDQAHPSERARAQRLQYLEVVKVVLLNKLSLYTILPLFIGLIAMNIRVKDLVPLQFFHFLLFSGWLHDPSFELSFLLRESQWHSCGSIVVVARLIVLIAISSLLIPTNLKCVLYDC